MIFLWSDILVFALIAFLAITVFFAYRDHYTRARWQKALASPLRSISLTILLVFILIGVLDSIHYLPNNSNQLQSLLDWLLSPISNNLEVTYSAPFATHSFMANMVLESNRQISWITPALQHISPVPILPQVLLGICDALILWLFATGLLWMLFIKIGNRKISMRNPSVIAWCTLGVIICIDMILWRLMHHYHVLGTDKVGVDILYATLKSIRTGLIIGTITTIITLPFAMLCGALAGFFGGWVDDAIQYVYITLSSIPGVLLIAAAALSFDLVISQHIDLFPLTAQRTDVRLLMLCCILGITSWTMLCRILRAETLKLREQEFIMAARVMGLNNWQIIRNHILPNLTHIILISIALDFSGLVLAEAVLSYVGVGVDPAMFSWGNMINVARLELGRVPVIWWSLTGAFIFMFVLVLSANIFADGVRDAFDPRAK